MIKALCCERTIYKVLGSMILFRIRKGSAGTTSRPSKIPTANILIFLIAPISLLIYQHDIECVEKRCFSIAKSVEDFSTLCKNNGNNNPTGVSFSYVIKSRNSLRRFDTIDLK
ncbi:hypothetical protein ADS79_03475 [Brevibacillus reuszeri]|uniref:Uncharacterized protein n=1 Tax=Brevibacillus reuszeri TaxID=54915 RepID=A0A0K9Z028_9BACL|nr:hypothetical protein ADS79_03475 [Brevibacillus reuszeri]